MADRNTMQKEIIHQTLCGMGCHPTAAMVYGQVHQNHPTIRREKTQVFGKFPETYAVLDFCILYKK